MLLGNKKGNGHEFVGNKRGAMTQLGMKGKTMSTLKIKRTTRSRRKGERITFRKIVNKFYYPQSV